MANFSAIGLTLLSEDLFKMKQCIILSKSWLGLTNALWSMGANFPLKL